MSSFSDEERAREWLLDIIDYADRIARYVEGRSFNDFTGGTMLRDAVERRVLVITEAAVRLGPEHFGAVAPETQLHELRGLGNLLRHAYHQISAKVMWDTVTVDIPALREACARAVS